MEFITEQIDFILTTYPQARYILAWYLIIRLVNKPLFLIVEKYVSLTETTKDNEFLEKLYKTPLYKLFRFSMDLGFSIKLPKGK